MSRENRTQNREFGEPLKKADRFFRFFMGCQNHLYAFILVTLHNEEDAEDILQDTVVALWEQFDEFEPGRSFLAWAMGIARNKVLVFLRQTRRTRTRLSQKTYEQILQHTTLIADKMSERIKAVRECTEKLTDPDRKIVVMRYEENIQIKKIAERMGRSPNGMYRTMARIHHLLENCVRMMLDRWERA
jgi:RNA polymerase sigma-70 factor (ECF subfamily)